MKLKINTLLILFIIISMVIFSSNVKALDIAISSVKVRESVEYSPETVWDLGYTGNGINIAVIDGGVDDEHPDLEGKFIAGADFTQPETILAPRDGTYNPDDELGHGTACAGAIMSTGSDSDGVYKGSAPDSNLLDLKVYKSPYEPGAIAQILITEPENIVPSFEWSVSNKDEFNINIISISMGYYPTGSNGTDVASVAANKAVESGIVVIAAGMNEGPDNNGFYGIGAADKVITVGATDDRSTINRNDDTIAFFSNRGPRADDGDDNPYDELKPDIVAPGVDITTLACSYNLLPADGYIADRSGTSFSAPIVSGIVALMLEANPNLTPKEVKEILHITAEQRGTPEFPDYPFPHNKWNKSYGYGIVDAYEAIKMTLKYKNDYLKTPEINKIESPDDDGNYIISWTNIEGAEYYYLLEASNTIFYNYSTYKIMHSTYMEFNNKDNGEYYYKVIARSSTTSSEFSNVFNLTVKKIIVKTINSPEFIDAPQLPVSENNYELKWSNIENASYYVLQEDSNTNFMSQIELYNGSNNFFILTDKEKGTNYYRVKAINNEVESKWSNIISITFDNKSQDDIPFENNSKNEITFDNKSKDGEEKSSLPFQPIFIVIIIIILLVVMIYFFNKKRRKKQPIILKKIVVQNNNKID
ncbi:MAG: S8 family serine peptidase [Thermoplasmata archaeon]|nr:MAG: S8 family serine peptidase [Thermoplasmata archaeon]